MSAHTPGPLTVKVSDARPHYIVTTDSNDVVVFSTPFPCHSSSDKCAVDTLECRKFKAHEREKYAAINRRALADEVLRAAAPELLEALKWAMNRIEMKAPHQATEGDGELYGFAAAKGIIAKATGGAAS